LRPKGLTSSLVVMFVFPVICLIFSTALAQKDPYKIGVILTAAGRYAALGGPQRDGAFLAAEGINRRGGVNGHMLELIFEDDGGDPSVAARLAKKLIGENKVSAIFGGTPIVSAQAIALVCEEKKIPLIAPVPQTSVVKNKRFAFINTVTSEITAVGQARYIVEELRWKKVAIVHDTTEYGILISALVKQALKEKLSETVSYEFISTDTDLTPILLKIKAFNPDGISLVGSIPSAPAIFMKQKKGLGIEIPVIGPTSLTTQTFINLVGEAGNGMMLQSNVNYTSQSQGAREFFESMEKKYPGTLPLAFHAFGWDGIKLFAKVMENVGSDPLKIRDALENIKGYDGARGLINLSPEDHSGFTINHLYILKIERKRLVHVHSFK